MKFVYPFIFLLFLFSSNVFAESAKFNVSSDSTYKIAENGLATITQNFVFTNLTNYYFPTAYLANLPHKEIYNLRAYDKTGGLKIDTKIVNNIRQVNIKLGEQQIGLGKQISWTIAYETWEVAKKNGRLWEIFIPRPARLEGQTDFSVGLYVPDSFGKTVYIKPESSLDNHLWFDIKGAGIFAVYDPKNFEEPYQGYDFKLTYDIYNPKIYPAYLDIALPPDTARQKVFISEISPKPVNVLKDSDGNWLARYQLGPTQKEKVIAKGYAAVFLKDKFTKEPILPEKYLKSEKYWEVDDFKIKEISRQLKSPKDIYQFVVSNLRYKQGNSRLGALKSLSNNLEATSLDFTDLFVTLARSLHIPAREIEGYANGSLHAWPEYFDKEKNSWVPVDPTWGQMLNGTDYFNILDFSHLVFVIHAKNSSMPEPPKTFEINYHEGDLDFSVAPKLGFSSDVPSNMTSGFASTARFFIENYGPTAFDGSSIIFNGESMSTEQLLPFANKTVDFKILPKPWLADQNDIMNLKFEQQERSFTVNNRPFYRNNFILTVSILFSLGLISIIAQITRSVYLFRQKGKSDLRGKSKKSS